MHSVRNVLVAVILCAVWLAPNVAGAQDQPRFSVMGVVIKPNFAIAWIGEPTYTKDNFVRVREGDRVGPYQILKIHEDRVEITGPSGPQVVRLSASAPDTAQPSSGPTTTAGVAPPAPPAAERIPEERIAESRARMREFRAQHPELYQGFNRLLDVNKVQQGK